MKKILEKKYAIPFLIFVSLALYMRLFIMKQRKDKNRKEKIAAIVLSWKRIINLPLVVYGLKRQSYIDDIIVFHNYPSRLKIPGCKNIFSSKNQGCIIRHKLASRLKGYDYFVFSDDDLMILDDLSEDVLPAIRRYGRKSVLGLYGHNINKRERNRPYSEGQTVGPSPELKKVDIVKERFHIISREGIRQMDQFKISKPALLSEDDIRANVILQYLNRKPSYLLPLKSKVVDLPNFFARENRKDHFRLRDLAVKQAMEWNWHPL